MSNTKRTLAQIISSIFPKSEKPISDALSVDDYNVFTGELKTEAERADGLAEQLETANQKIEDLEAQLAEATKADPKKLQDQLFAAEAERDKYKAHYDAAVKAGVISPGEDMNSRKVESLTGYNQHALDVFKRGSN